MLAAVTLVLVSMTTVQTGSVSGLVFDTPDGPLSPSMQPLAEPPLRIGAFNIQVFGRTKYSKTAVREVLVQVLERYDIALVLEIRDSTQTAFENLRLAINNHLASAGRKDHYETVLSGRLGRTRSKEQYGFLYRPSRVNVTSTFQFADVDDAFERPPFGVRFSSPGTVIRDFGMVAIHISPSKAVNEINNLTAAYEAFQTHWRMDDIVIAGDNFAKGRHDLVTADLRHDSRLTWLLDNADSTVAHTLCHYDRFVVGGGAMKAAVMADSVKTYRFDDAMGINKTLASAVSDHYPIELKLQGNIDTGVQQHITTSLAFTVKDTLPIKDVNNIRAIYRSPSCAPAQFSVKLEWEESHMSLVSATSQQVTADHVITSLRQFSSLCPGTLTASLISTVQAYMTSSYLEANVPSVYGLVTSHTSTFDVKITCHLQSASDCLVTIKKRISGR